MKNRKNIIAAWAVTVGLGALTSLGIGAWGTDSAQAQLLPLWPSPKDYVSHLDVECYAPEGDVVPLNEGLTINHLNPVIREMGIEKEEIKVTEFEEACVPVMKDQSLPPQPAQRFISYTDLACYKAYSSKELDVTLKLSHLNPVLVDLGLEDEEVRLGRLEQLCTPVEKKGAELPPLVNRLVSHVDVACYSVETKSADRKLWLDHLNPLLRPLKGHAVYLADARQLCLPVAKDGKIPPRRVLEIVQWVDLLKYRVDPLTEVAPFSLVLRHLNPRFEKHERFEAAFRRPTTLGVPVAKNGFFPPGE